MTTPQFGWVTTPSAADLRHCLTDAGLERYFEAFTAFLDVHGAAPTMKVETQTLIRHRIDRKW
jgi:hypothetical protein